jgi:hypothetical protein
MKYVIDVTWVFLVLTSPTQQFLPFLFLAEDGDRCTLRKLLFFKSDALDRI